MRKCAVLSVFVLLLAASGGAAVADEVTLEGKVLCAKCALHDQEKCQNVLSVEDGDDPTYYYMTKNDTYEEFGEVCKTATAVRVTGELKEDGDKTWIIASSIEPLDEPGS